LFNLLLQLLLLVLVLVKVVVLVVGMVLIVKLVLVKLVVLVVTTMSLMLLCFMVMEMLLCLVESIRLQRPCPCLLPRHCLWLHSLSCASRCLGRPKCDLLSTCLTLTLLRTAWYRLLS
jgi:hypothetical protein